MKRGPLLEKVLHDPEVTRKYATSADKRRTQIGKLLQEYFHNWYSKKLGTVGVPGEHNYGNFLPSFNACFHKPNHIDTCHEMISVDSSVIITSATISAVVSASPQRLAVAVIRYKMPLISPTAPISSLLATIQA